MSRGIFSLNESYNEQISGDWSTASDVWLLASPVIVRESPFGYFGGGHDSPSYSSSILRIDYSNDSANATSRGTLTTATRFVSATGNISYGYFDGGGDPAPGKTIIDRLDYSNDTATATPKGPLASATYKASATGNADYGYWGGGKPSPSSGRTLVERLDFANDTATAVAKGSLSAARYFLTATGNLNHGYFGGGASYPAPADVTTVDRLDYSSDTTACVAKGPLSGSGSEAPAASSNANFGYYGGGASAPGPKSSKVERLDYSSDTTAAVAKGPLTDVKKLLASTGNSSHGYFAGGNVGPDTSDIDRVDYSNDTATAITKAMLPAANTSMGGVSAAANALASNFIGTTSNIGVNRVPVGTDYGYIFGGYNGSYLSSIQRIDYSNDTATAPQVASLPTAMNNRATVGNTNYAWVHPGYGTHGTNLQRFDYSNDTSGTSARGSMPESKSGDSTGNKHFGYFSLAHPETSIYRLEYANDTAKTIFRTYRTVTNQVYSGGSASNSSYGYFAGGGQNGTAGGTVMDRVDYSNDTATAVAKGPLTSNQTYGVRATGSANFAYWAGGSGGSGPAPGFRSTTDRLDYSSDTTACVAKGPLTSTKYHTAATGNRSFGYWSGGQPGGGQSDVDRLDYSSDTTAMAPKGPLTHASYGHDAESSRANALPTENIYSTVAFSSEEVSGTKVITRGTNRGYWGGGYLPAARSTVDRIDFDNDTATASPKGYLSRSNYYMTALSNKNYGYNCGGLTPYTSIVDRIDYSNDTATALARGPLTGTNGAAAGLHNNDYGYHAGGNNPSNTSTVDRLDYANDTSTLSPKGNLDTGRGKMAGTSNNNYGWLAGGKEPPISSSERIDFSNDTATAVARGNLTTPRQGFGAAGNQYFGYYGGGDQTPGGGHKSIVDRNDYSNDTTTAVAKGPLANIRRYLSATGNTSYGYFAGGEYPSSDPLTFVDRIDYSNDTPTASPRGPLLVARAWMASATSSTANALQDKFTISTPFAFGENTRPSLSGHGYIAGGNPSQKSTVDRLDFSNDNILTSIRSPLNFGKNGMSGVSNQTHGYFFGGTPGQTLVDRIDYSNDTAAVSPRGYLLESKRYWAEVGNTDYGWMTGSFNPIYTKIDRIDYSNDTANATTRGYLSSARYSMGAAGNANFGWFGGGYNSDDGGYKSLVDRMEYSNDTATSSPKSPLTRVNAYIGATGNANYGWFGGGYSGSTQSTIDRIDYSNHTASPVTKGPLVQKSWAMGAMGNSSYGWWSGGDPAKSVVQRLDFANDTAGTSRRADMTTAKTECCGTSNLENGLPQGFPQGTVGSYGSAYFAGGQSPDTVTTIQRIDYSNDTATASPRGNLAQQRYNYGQSVSSISYGYVMGGYTPSIPEPNGNLSSIERIDYSNDTATTPAVANLSVGSPGVYSGGATGNVNFGYLGGGNKHPGSANSAMQRIDYGSDTVTQVSSFASGTRGFIAATGNKNYGYWGGGPSSSLVERLDYSIDSTNAVEKGPLSTAIRLLDATGNNNFGYFIGGQNPSSPNANSEVRRLDYSNDTATTSQRSYLVAGKYMFAGTGNSSYGYVSGGAEDPGPNPSSATSRIDYSNDTVNSSPKGPLVKANRSVSGMSAREHGLPIIGSTFSGILNTVPRQYYPSSQRVYWIDGNVAQRFNIPNDTVNAVPRWNTTTETNNDRSGVSSLYYGYVKLGSGSKIERLDYANDTPTSVHLNLTNAGSLMGGTTNTDYGYIAGGGTNPSMVQRIDYSSDTTAASVRGNLADNFNYWCKGVGYANFGYFIGGQPGISTVNRVDYSNDSAAAVRRADGITGWGSNATGNTSYGYFGGGGPGSTRTDVKRLDYSSDTTTVSPKGPLAAGRSEHATASGNISYGYWAGGEPSTTHDSHIDRIDYSNDTATALQRGLVTTRIQNADKLCGGQDGLPQ